MDGNNMRTQEICHHLDQRNKLRVKLGDYINAPGLIRKPVGMRTLVFQNRVLRLCRHEHAIAKKLIEGLGRG